MSLEARVTLLENKFETLDDAVRSLIKITGETHRVVLENQRENRIRFDQQDRELAALKELVLIHDKRFDQQDRELAALKEHALAHDKRFDQLEFLIRQLLPNSNN